MVRVHVLAAMGIHRRGIMIGQLNTGFLLFTSLGLSLGVVALIVIILLAASVMLRPSRWHEWTREVWLGQSTERKQMLIST